MLVNLLLLLLTTVSCEAQQPRFIMESNVYKRGINHSERAEFLHWHNYYRRQVENPRAADMTYLLYHKELETAALDWAAQCNFLHGNFNFTRYQLDPKLNIGQNIAVRMGTYSIQNSVFRWFDEYSDYSFQDKSCKPGEKCGHYEQVAGAVVTHIGCAIVYCSKYINSRIIKENAYNTVCDYYPSAIRSNWSLKNDKPFREKLKIYEEGEPCTACRDGYKVCDDKLCRSSPPCLTTIDTECRNPVNTTTCLCDASVYPVYHDSSLSPSSSTQSSPKQATASVMKGLTSTITDLPLTKATERVATAPITSTKTSTVGSTTSQSTQRQTTRGRQILQKTTTEILETTSAEAVEQVSRTQSTSTETRTLEIYTSEITKQLTFMQTDNDTITALEITDEGNRQHEITASTTVVPGITTIPTSPDITTRPASPDITTRPASPDITTRPASLDITTRPASPYTTTIAASPHTSTTAAATSSGHFGPGDNMTTAHREPSLSEQMQPMCFIKMSTKYLTQNDMLPKDPGAIGDELFQRRWRQIQSQPKLSLQVLQQVVASRAAAAALPFSCLSVTMQCFHFMVAAIVWHVMQAFP